VSDIPAALVRCEWHRWISTHQPDFPVYWIRQCSQCGYYDPVDMAEQIAKHATTPEQASLKAERDAALATIERVEALAAHWEHAETTGDWPTATDLRAALEPTP